MLPLVITQGQPQWETNITDMGPTLGQLPQQRFVPPTSGVEGSPFVKPQAAPMGGAQGGGGVGGGSPVGGAGVGFGQQPGGQFLKGLSGEFNLNRPRINNDGPGAPPAFAPGVGGQMNQVRDLGIA